jgi:hypothetical protein
MSKDIFRKLFQSALAISLALGMAYGTWLLLVAFFNSITAASPEVTAAIVGAMATVLVGILAVLISQSHERKRSAEEAHRLKKVEMYQGFINMISRMIGARIEQLDLKEPEQKELVQFLFKYKSEILLWGSPKVIKAQIEFEAISSSGDHEKIFRAVNSMYAAIREDIGLSNAGLNKLELVKLSLNDEARSDLR